MSTLTKKKGPLPCPFGHFLAHGKPGEFFYTDKPDRNATARAVYYKRQVITERLIAITTGGKDPQAKYITKITLVK